MTLFLSLALAAALVISALRAAMSAANPTRTDRLSQPSPCAIETTMSGLRPLSSARRNSVSSGASAESLGIGLRAVRTAASPFLSIS